MIVQTQTATVYKGNGRRYLTKRAAYNAAAKAKINERCECDSGDQVTPLYCCHYHADLERFHKMKRRLARLYQTIDAKSRDSTSQHTTELV